MDSHIYVVIYLGLAIAFYVLVPEEIKENKFLRILQNLFLGLGVFSLYAMLFLIGKLNNDLIRKIIIYYETIFFSILNTGLILGFVRYTISYIAIRNNHFSFAKFISKKSVYFITLFIFALYFLNSGIYNSNHPVKKYNKVVLAANNNKLKIAMICDLHLGAGSFKENVDYLCEQLNKEDSDTLLIVGDVTDETTNQADLEYFVDCINSLNYEKGIYYAYGNHETFCDLEISEYFKNTQIKILNNEAILLDDNLALVGRYYDNDVALRDILKNSNIKEDIPCVVMQHIPRLKGNELKTNNLVLCGHTHGIWTTAYKATITFNDVAYGYEKIDNSQIIVSSGTAVWGYHYSFPTKNEYNIIDLEY